MLSTFPGPAPLRPFIRSQQRLAFQALFQAPATALKRLSKEERVIGTELPGCTGVLPTGGRPLQAPPRLPSIVPGGGLSKDCLTWRPSRAHCFGPVTALSPLSRALCKAALRQAGWLEPSDPQV